MLELPDPRSVCAESLHLWRLLAVRAVVDFEMSQADAAAQHGVSNTTMTQWVSLYREQGEAGLAVQPQGRPEGSGRALSSEQERTMTCRIGINGFGRIGCMVLRRSMELPEHRGGGGQRPGRHWYLTYLFKYDSVHGPFPGQVSNDDNTITVNGRAVQYPSERDPAKIPWGQAGVDVVIESSEAFRGRADASGHLQSGARKVLISAPSDDVDVTIVPGVNDAMYDPARHQVLSMASCTTNYLAPVAKVLQEQFGILQLFITTVHAYTASQSIMDKPMRKRRRGRAAALSMIPTTTEAAKATALVLPELKGKMDGMAIRVPIPDGSVTDIVVQLEKSTRAKDINAGLREASQRPPLQGILEVNDDQIVSVDIVGNPHSSIVDGPSTIVLNGTTAKILAWYDNEWGYSCRLAELSGRLLAP